MLDAQKPLQTMPDLLTIERLLEYFDIKDKRTLYNNLELLNVRAKSIGKTVYVRKVDLERGLKEYFEK